MGSFLVGTPVLVGLIAVALLFDFLNGLHDSANSIATVVATRVLRPFTAVVWASYQVAMTPTLGGFQVPVISIRCPDMRIG
jgi:phosphate/sulfate permease